MNKIKVNKFIELENIRDRLNENQFVIDLADCDIKEKTRAIDFFAGLTYLNGAIDKLSCDEFKITLNIDKLSRDELLDKEGCTIPHPNIGKLRLSDFEINQNEEC